jgi:hypothetical protein
VSGQIVSLVWHLNGLYVHPHCPFYTLDLDFQTPKIVQMKGDVERMPDTNRFWHFSCSVLSIAKALGWRTTQNPIRMLDDLRGLVGGLSVEK